MLLLIHENLVSEVVEFDLLGQIIGFMIALCTYITYYGDETNDGTPAGKNRRQDGRQY
jgi:hypothetical protein